MKCKNELTMTMCWTRTSALVDILTSAAAARLMSVSLNQWWHASAMSSISFLSWLPWWSVDSVTFKRVCNSSSCDSNSVKILLFYYLFFYNFIIFVFIYYYLLSILLFIIIILYFILSFITYYYYYYLLFILLFIIYLLSFYHFRIEYC